MGRRRACSSAAESGGGVGAGGLPAEVEEIGAPVEEGEGLGQGLLFGREAIAVREGVGGEVEDAHEEGSLAEGDGAAREMPEVARARGHGASVRGWSGQVRAVAGN